MVLPLAGHGGCRSDPKIPSSRVKANSTRSLARQEFETVFSSDQNDAGLITHRARFGSTDPAGVVTVQLDTTGIRITTKLSHHELYSIPDATPKPQLYRFNHRIMDLEKVYYYLQ